jgi:hypothetical protein
MDDSAERARPSRHGAFLGEALSLIEMAGRKDFPGELAPLCATCAFRPGSLPNQTAETGVIALNTVLGIDKDRFACHHGMKDGQPSKLCAGYIAARLAPFSFTKEVLAAMLTQLDRLEGPDEVREAFDAWFAQVDSTGKTDEYKLARIYASYDKARA